MSSSGRSGLVTALKDSKRLLVLVPTMFSLISSIENLTATYQQRISSELGGSIMDDSAMRKIIHKKRWARKKGKKAKPYKRSSWRCGTNDELTEDGSFDEEVVGLSQEEFDLVLAHVRLAVESEKAKDGSKSRPMSFSIEAGVALTLEFLRDAESPRKLGKRYRIPKSTVDRMIKYYLLRMRATLDFIGDIDPELNITAGRFDSEGSIDCSTHPRDRIHPGEDNFYRSDKGIHFLTSQAVVDHLGYYIRLTIGSGHNNDQGMTHLSNLSEWVERYKIRRLLSDLGYSGELFVRPISLEQQLIRGVDADLRQAVKHQAAERAVVEHVNSWVKNWKFADRKCKMGPEMQAIGLIVCAQLHQLTLIGAERAKNRAHLFAREN